uniref:prolipoprotein diacylglyceryl transferase n=1 Tax=uncultured Draconibacterium sp. TaxID=1573823 RepID=UPI003217A70A
MLLSYINWNVDPEMVRLFDAISIRYYSLLFVSGLIVGYYIVKQIYLKEKESVENLEKLAVFVFAGTVIGARLGHCLFYEPGYYLSHPLEMILPFKWAPGKSFEFTGYQGLASHGGAIGVLTAILIYCRKYKVKFLWVLDRLAIATPVTGAFIRIGNFMNSEIIGSPTNSDYGIVFNRVDLLPRHPAQLYEAFSYILIFVLLLWFYSSHKEKRKDGFIFGLFLVLLFTARFLIEFFKINQVNFEDGMLLNMGQLLSIPFVLTGFTLMIWKRRLEQQVKKHGIKA